jgi:hypothetical protein
MTQVENSGKLLEVHLGGMSGLVRGGAGSLSLWSKPGVVDLETNAHPVGKLMMHNLPFPVNHMWDYCFFILLEGKPVEDVDQARVFFITGDIADQVKEFADIDLSKGELHQYSPRDQVKKIGVAEGKVGHMDFGDTPYYFWYSSNPDEDTIMFNEWASKFKDRFIDKWQLGSTPANNLELEDLIEVGKVLPTSTVGRLPFDVLELSLLQVTEPAKYAQKIGFYKKYPFVVQTLQGLIPQHLESFVDLTTQALDRHDAVLLNTTFSSLGRRVVKAGNVFHHVHGVLDNGRGNGPGNLDTYHLKQLKRYLDKPDLPNIRALRGELEELSEEDTLERKKEILDRIQVTFSQDLVDGIF